MDLFCGFSSFAQQQTHGVEFVITVTIVITLVVLHHNVIYSWIHYNRYNHSYIYGCNYSYKSISIIALTLMLTSYNCAQVSTPAFWQWLAMVGSFMGSGWVPDLFCVFQYFTSPSDHSYMSLYFLTFFTHLLKHACFW